MASHATVPLPHKEPNQMTAAMRRIIKRVMGVAARRLYELCAHHAEADLPRFANAPKNVRIELPRRISEAERIYMGDDVNIGPNSLLVAQTSYPSRETQNPDRPIPVEHFEPRIVIGNRVSATGNLTIDAMQSVVIEDDVMFASNVIIMDGLHGFRTANEPYKYQPMWRIAPVVIGRGCWIAQNVVIMPGVTIGPLSIIGANSIVAQSIPAKSIAFGNPARVVKRWDEQQQCWMSAEQDAESPTPARATERDGDARTHR